METSPRSELKEVMERIKVIRKKAGLDPKTGYSDKKATLCCPASKINPKKNIGYLETSVNSMSIIKILKDMGFDLKDLLEIEEGSEWQFISWNLVKTKLFDAIIIAKNQIERKKKYKILAYKCGDYFRNSSDISEYIIKDINKKNDARGKTFEEPQKVYGVFMGDDRIYVAIENKEVNILYEFLNNLVETTKYVLEQKFPYDFILRWSE